MNEIQKSLLRNRIQHRPGHVIRPGMPPNTSGGSGRLYYYVRSNAQRPSGGMMPVLLGPFDSFQKAQDVGFTRIHRQFDVVSLPTRDLAQASRMLKADILQESSDIDHSLRRLKHTL